MPFPGLPDNPTATVRIPEQFFYQALFEIADLDELKLTLYAFWHLDRKPADDRFLRLSDMIQDTQLAQSMGSTSEAAQKAILEALYKVVNRGVLLQAEAQIEGIQELIICLNTPQGRKLMNAIKNNDGRMPVSTGDQAASLPEHPNIFQLYEANIGPLTPMIAETLRDAENTYQPVWIEDAFEIAVERNKRSWHYIEAILRHWQEGGRDDRKNQQNRRDTEEARRRYGEWEE